MTYFEFLLWVSLVTGFYFLSKRNVETEKMLAAKVDALESQIEGAVQIKELAIRLEIDDARCTYSVSAEEIKALLVERWLSKRGLMMTPKGKDFLVDR